MKVCFFGSYDINYSKNVVLIKGLMKNNVIIVHCHDPKYFTIFHYPKLLWQFLKNARDCDIIFVAFFGHYDVWFAWIVAKLFGKKLVFDPLISIYNTRIEDRRYFKLDSFRAKFYIFLDWLNVHLADKVFIDTIAHYNYYNKLFHLKENKVSIIRVGADESQLVPTSHARSKHLIVLFYGSYQPSQGAETIIKAASLLTDKNILWKFVGDGQDRPKVENYSKKHKLRKVKFMGFMSFSDLVQEINKADIVFGVFGDTIKTNMVIHNKIFQALAMGKALITQDTPAVREIVEDGKQAFLVKSDIEEIASKILEFLKNPKKTAIVGGNARKLFLSNFSTKKVGKQAKEAFERILIKPH